MILIAHAGHWVLPVLYAVPPTVVVGLLVFSAVRDRRRERRRRGSDAGLPRT